MAKEHLVHPDLAKTFLFLGNLISRVSAEMRLQADISDNNLLEVVKRYEHDMERMSKDQGPSIAPQKRIGVLVFWIRRLKPVHMAKPVGEHSIRSEIQDINEQIAIRIATLLIVEAAENRESQCEILSSIQAEKKIAEFEDFITHHWRANGYMNYVLQFRYLSE